VVEVGVDHADTGLYIYMYLYIYDDRYSIVDDTTNITKLAK